MTVDRSAVPADPHTLAPIGLLGGSFDPIHIGHLQLARDARDHLHLAEVRLLPAGQPWQKAELTAAAHRARMVALAIDAEPGLVLDTHEIDRGGPTYTIDTLRALRAELGPQRPLVLVIGSDQLRRLDTWRDWIALTDYAHLAVAARNGEALDLAQPLADWRKKRLRPVAALREAAAGCVVDLPMTPVDASATEIRMLLRAPRSTAGDARLARLVPAAVLLYIRREGLYAASV